MVGYTTTGRPSTHQQQPMSFTRALEISENLDPGQAAQNRAQYNMQRASTQPQNGQNTGDKETEKDERRDSVYDMNSYEISVWRYAHK